MRTRPGWTTMLTLACCAAFLLLAVLVATGATQALDVATVALLRPDDEWGTTQVRFSPWLERLQPSRMFLLLGVTAAVAAARRRSWRPLVVGAVLATSTVALTVLAKIVLERPDPHGYVTSSGGSYPSGHMAALVACLGGCVLVLGPRVRWWHWTPVVAGTALLAWAQLVSAAHWLTDLLGGALLALVVLGALGRHVAVRDRLGPRQ